MFRLAGVESLRISERERIRALMQRCDIRTLLGLLADQRVLAVHGTRLLEICPDLAPPELEHAVSTGMTSARRVHAVDAHLTRSFWQRLEQAGIPAVALKGPLLADRLYPDPGLRHPPTDLDFLIRAEQLDDAVGQFRELGYHVQDASVWADGLPHYHYGLCPDNPTLPRVELHWRIHWYEKEFARRLIARSLREEHEVRVPAPADDLAALLIIWTRDGFTGLRLATDISAWWDAHGDELERPGLEQVLEENPRLRAALLAGLDAAERVVGLPRAALASGRWSASRRSVLAVRLVNWRLQGDSETFATDITLVDLLLTPLAAAGVFVRHYYFQPLSCYVATYRWRSRHRALNELRRVVHASGRMLRAAWRYQRRLWAIRADSFDPLPPRPAPAEIPGPPAPSRVAA